MTTVVINESSYKGRMLMTLLRMLRRSSDPVVSIDEQSPYNPAYVEKIKRSEQQIREGRGVKVDLDKLWD
jgi:hypothetical protein